MGFGTSYNRHLNDFMHEMEIYPCLFTKCMLLNLSPPLSYYI